MNRDWVHMYRGKEERGLRTRTGNKARTGKMVQRQGLAKGWRTGTRNRGPDNGTKKKEHGPDNEVVKRNTKQGTSLRAYGRWNNAPRTMFHAPRTTHHTTRTLQHAVCFKQSDRNECVHTCGNSRP